MQPTGKRARRLRRAFLSALGACLALPAFALATPEVTVRVEGETESKLAETTVPIGTGSGWAQAYGGGGLPQECKDDTAYQAIELATEGKWDRELYVVEILGEEHTYEEGEEYWSFYYNNNYADWGVCDQHLKDGDTVLMQAVVSGPPPTYIPDSVPIAFDSVEPSAEVVELGQEVTVHLTSWRPIDIFGEEDPEIPGHWIIPPSEEVDAAGYTVVAGGVSEVTDAFGNATLTLEEPGPVRIEAYVPESATNWSRAVPIELCVDDFEPGTC